MLSCLIKSVLCVRLFAAFQFCALYLFLYYLCGIYSELLSVCMIMARFMILLRSKHTFGTVDFYHDEDSIVVRCFVCSCRRFSYFD